MECAEQIRLAYRGMTAPRQRPVTWAMVVTVAALCATWIAISGLMDGAERVSRYRIDSRPLARRILLGDEDLTPLLPSQVDQLETKVRAQLGDRLEFVSPFWVLDWPLKDMFDMKGRTINLPRGEAPGTHPLFRDLKLEQDRSSEVPSGLFLCPRFFDKPGFDRQRPPEFLWLDLRRPVDPANKQVNPIQYEKIPVRGVLADNPKELVYFIIPEAEAIELLTQPPLQSVRMAPLPEAWLVSDEQVGKLEQAAREYEHPTFGQIISDAYVDSKDRLNLELKDQFWTRSDWQAVSDHLRSRLPGFETGTGMPPPLSQIEDSRGGATPIPPRNYPLIGMYFTDLDALPQAAEILSKDELLEGHVDRVIAELISQLRSFSQAKELILQTVRISLVLLCFISVFIVQFFRCVICRPEAGMLNAMGLSNCTLGAILCWEGITIWLAGTTLGLGLGWLFGCLRSYSLYKIEQEYQLGFDPGLPEVGTLYGATLLIVLVSTQIAAGILMYHKQPAELLEAT